MENSIDLENIDENIGLTDLIDVPILQKMQDAFARMVRMAALTTDENGVPVTKGTNFSEFCTEFCRKSDIGRKRCENCDKMGAVMSLEKHGPVSYYCHANLVDFAAPIMLKDKMIGSFIGGQVLAEEPDLDRIREVAREIEVDEESFVEAAKKTQIVPKAAIDRATAFIYEFSEILSDMAYKTYVTKQLSEAAMQASTQKSDFLANMSHEIRTPMNAVLGMAEMALREEMSPAAKEYLYQIKSSGKNLLVIINDILDFSKIESGKMDIIEVEYEPFSMINDLTSIVCTRIGSKDIEFTMDISPDLPRKLKGDNIRIRQILINLLNNAVKFTAKGEVHLKLFGEDKGDGTFVMKAQVSDTGIGIKNEDLGKLFQSFQQVDSKRNRNIEGTGLGLAISQQLLRLMNGSISVESEYNKGSVFSFELPQEKIAECVGVPVPEAPVNAVIYIENQYVKKQLICDLERIGTEITDVETASELDIKRPDYFITERSLIDDRVRRNILSDPSVKVIIIDSFNSAGDCDIPNARIIRKPVYSMNIYAAMGIGEEYVREEANSLDDFVFTAPEARVLIVDDNPINLTVAKGLLEPLNMQIDLAGSAAETIEMVKKTMYDLVFMDHMMPEVDGIETTHIIRRLMPTYADVPIIALTANAVSGAKEMFLSEGMNDFVAKPIETKTIISKLRKWLPQEKIIPADKHDAVHTEPAPVIKIEGLNTENAMKLLGTQSLFMSVLKEYYCSIGKKSEQIREYYNKAKWKDYTIEVHALKSLSRQIGADELSALAAALEKAGNEKDIPFINANTDKLLEMYTGYIDILRPYFPECEEKQEKKSASHEEIAEMLDKLSEALDNFDTLAIDEVVEEMASYEYEECFGDYIETLKTAAEECDIDVCCEIVSRWKEDL